MKRIIYYLKIWLLMARNAFIVWFNRRNLLIIFLLGKVIRYIFYFTFLYFLVNSSKGLSGFTGNQVLFFTATYVLIDTVAQFFFRSVYTFRQLIVSGDFDLVLLKPVNALFRVLMGGPDPIDFVTIPPIIFVTFYLGSILQPTPLQVFYYLLLVANGLVIAMAFHIVVLSLGVITLEIDHTIMVFRDLSSMGRLPIDIYKEPFKSVLTYIIPVGLMITLPAKGLFGLVTPVGVLFSIAFGFVFLFLSLRFWNFALTKYTSA